MITAPEVAKALYGAWRLARFDPSGLDHFDNTVEAFWRSFYAMLIAAPGHVVLVALGHSAQVATRGPVDIFLIEAIGYVIGWFAFPLVMIYIAGQLDRGERYFRYIVASNWAVVVQIGLLLAVVAVVRGFQLPALTAGYFQFAAMVAVLIYSWFITRVGLDISGRAAAAIVFLDLASAFSSILSRC